MRHILGKIQYFKHNKTPASIIYNILDLWLNSEFNAAKISVKLGELYNQEEVNKLIIVFKFFT